jgi:hypothetical protein
MSNDILGALVVDIKYKLRFYIISYRDIEFSVKDQSVCAY